MGKSLYLLTGKKADALMRTSFEKEKQLQEIIENNPNILLRDSDIENDNQLYLIQRELRLPGTTIGETDLSLDHFLVDKFGIPVLVEVKQVSKPEIRRKVVGQMMDYAARISFYDSVELQEMFERNNEQETPIGDSHDFWKQVSNNLRSGRLRLVFAADSIPSTLKMIIELLDRSMPEMDVYGVEITKYSSENHEYLTTNFIQNTVKSILSSPDSNAALYSDDDMRACLNEAYGEWAYQFFEDFLKNAESLGLTFKFGAASTYIPCRFYLDDVEILSFDADKTGANVHFNSSVIEAKGNILRSALLADIADIDPRSKSYNKSRKVYLRLHLGGLEPSEKQEAVFSLVEKIVNALNDR